MLKNLALRTNRNVLNFGLGFGFKLRSKRKNVSPFLYPPPIYSTTFENTTPKIYHFACLEFGLFLFSLLYVIFNVKNKQEDGVTRHHFLSC